MFLRPRRGVVGAGSSDNFCSSFCNWDELGILRATVRGGKCEDAVRGYSGTRSF